MTNSKTEFIKSFMPETVINVECATINLDITDLSLGDILRNLNKIYTKNSRTRNAIISGSMVSAILCRTETLDPMNGIFIVLTNNELEVQLVSKNYIVICVAEDSIDSEERITDTINRITKYIAKNFKNSLSDLPTFYSKFIYDPSEYEDEDDSVHFPRTNDFTDLDD